MSLRACEAARWTYLSHLPKSSATSVHFRSSTHAFRSRCSLLPSDVFLASTSASTSHRRCIRGHATSLAQTSSAQAVKIESGCHGVDDESSNLQPFRIKKYSIRSRQVSPFAIQAPALPISYDFISHPRQFSFFSTYFESKFTALRDAYTSTQSLDSVRQEFKRDMVIAENIWKTYSVSNTEAWLSHNHDTRQRCKELTSFLLGSVLISADRIFDVLAALRSISDDFECRLACLYLTSLLHRPQSLSGDFALLKENPVMDRLRHPSTWPKASIKLSHLKTLIYASTPAQIQQMLADYQIRYGRLGTVPRVLASNFFVQKNLPEEAFNLFKELPTRVLQNPPYAVTLVCSRILSHDHIVHTETGPNFKYLTSLLGKGLGMNDKLYGRVVMRALLCNYDVVAWDVYRYAHSIGVSLPVQAHLAMLKRAFSNDDVTSLNEIMSHIRAETELFFHRTLVLYAMNMVRKVTHAQRTMSASEGLSHIMELYDRSYSRQLLLRFGFITTQPASKDTAKDLDPDIYALTFTVWAYILCHKDGKSAQPLWDRILRLGEQGDQTILECLHIDLLYNAYLFLHLRESSTVPNAIEVFHYMLERQYCKPTDRTWSILLCGLLRHNLLDEARKLYDLMQSHGFQITHIRGEYWPRGFTLGMLAKRIDVVLDEEAMPDGSPHDDMKISERGLQQEMDEEHLPADFDPWAEETSVQDLWRPQAEPVEITSSPAAREPEQSIEQVLDNALAMLMSSERVPEKFPVTVTGDGQKSTS